MFFGNFKLIEKGGRAMRRRKEGRKE